MSTNCIPIETPAMDLTETGRFSPSLLCHRTGVAAGTSDACGACDSCLWVAAMEAGFRANEREEAEADGGEL